MKGATWEDELLHKRSYSVKELLSKGNWSVKKSCSVKGAAR